MMIIIIIIIKIKPHKLVCIQWKVRPLMSVFEPSRAIKYFQRFCSICVYQMVFAALLTISEVAVFQRGLKITSSPSVPITNMFPNIEPEVFDSAPPHPLQLRLLISWQFNYKPIKHREVYCKKHLLTFFFFLLQHPFDQLFTLHSRNSD